MDERLKDQVRRIAIKAGLSGGEQYELLLKSEQDNKLQISNTGDNEPIIFKRIQSSSPQEA